MASPMPIEPAAAPAADVKEPEPSEKPEIRQRVWGLDARGDPSVSYPEFTYWAKIERAEEMEAERKFRELQGPWSFKKMIKSRFSKGAHREREKQEQQLAARTTADEKAPNEKTPTASAHIENFDTTSSGSSAAVSEEEWKTAARALRTASWGSVFYLITTDILGWSGAPYVFSTVGFGVGVAVYVIFGVAAFAAGLMLWKCFLVLDSSRFPILSYGDLFLRIFGPKTRHFINFGQALQQFCTVMVLILGNGQVLSQLAGPQLCFIVCMIIIMIIGIIGGGIRSLQRLGWICNLSVWLNIVSFLIVMTASRKYGIFKEPIAGSTLFKDTSIPVTTFAGEVPDNFQQQAHGFAAIFNGINNMVYAYSGGLLFVAFMAEMRHPFDFWKGMICAQTFIACVYLIFGAYVYSNFGQYSLSTIYQVIKPETLRETCNVFSLLTGIFACLLYFNIGFKTVYLEVFQEVLHFPGLHTKKGRWCWYALGPVYWAIAFVVAAAVPNLNGIVSIVGALLLLNFSYSFPSVAFLGYLVHEGATLPGEGFDPVTGESTYMDSGPKRWARGFMKRWKLTIPILTYALCAFACSGMGSWAAIEGLIKIFGPGGTVATSFGCASPMWPNSTNSGPATTTTAGLATGLATST